MTANYYMEKQYLGYRVIDSVFSLVLSTFVWPQK